MSTYLLIFAVIYVIICMCSKKSGKNRSVIWSLVWLVLMFINFANAQKLNEEMEYYRNYHENAEVVFDGIREISDNLENTGSIFSDTDTTITPAETSAPEPSAIYDAPGSLIYSASGTGDSIVTQVKVSQPSLLIFRTSDTGHHSVKAYYGSGEYEYDLLVNDSGASYNGKTYLICDRTYDFTISCGGFWEIEVYTIGYTTDLSFSGSGDYVTDIFQPKSQYYTITYTGTDHFSVKQRYGTGEYDYELLVNDSGNPYSGTIRLSHIDSPCFFEISGTGGNWTITPAQ